MCDKLQLDYLKYQNALVAAGLLIRSPVAGVYGLGGVFEDVIERFERYVTRMGTHLNAEVMRFPPVLDRLSYLKSDHLETFPNLIGSVHSFHGGDAEHRELMRRKQRGEDWSEQLVATALVMTPAACYPLYATASGNLPQGGRTVDLRAFVFRHEPSPDPARMQIFRQREYVRLGKPDDALAHRDDWLKRAEAMLRALGLEPKAVVANDPFFGRGGRMMASTQREQTLKFELVVPIACDERPTPVASSNYHLDHFGLAFGIKTADGAPAHTACIGFGLERIALALFRRHGFVPARWPAEVRRILDW
jgi:seryl-tRNA synthetase